MLVRRGQWLYQLRLKISNHVVFTDFHVLAFRSVLQDAVAAKCLASSPWTNMIPVRQADQSTALDNSAVLLLLHQGLVERVDVIIRITLSPHADTTIMHVNVIATRVCTERLALLNIFYITPQYGKS